MHHTANKIKHIQSDKKQRQNKNLLTSYPLLLWFHCNMLWGRREQRSAHPCCPVLVSERYTQSSAPPERRSVEGYANISHQGQINEATLNSRRTMMVIRWKMSISSCYESVKHPLISLQSLLYGCYLNEWSGELMQRHKEKQTSRALALSRAETMLYCSSVCAFRDTASVFSLSRNISLFCSSFTCRRHRHLSHPAHKYSIYLSSNI